MNKRKKLPGESLQEQCDNLLAFGRPISSPRIMPSEVTMRKSVENQIYGERRTGVYGALHPHPSTASLSSNYKRDKPIVINKAR